MLHHHHHHHQIAVAAAAAAAAVGEPLVPLVTDYLQPHQVRQLEAIHLRARYALPALVAGVGPLRRAELHLMSVPRLRRRLEETRSEASRFKEDVIWALDALRARRNERMAAATRAQTRDMEWTVVNSARVTTFLREETKYIEFLLGERAARRD